MHYSNGRPAKKGDIIQGKTYNGTPFTAVVIETVATSDTCNLQAIPITPTQCVTLTAKECIHADDVIAKPFAEQG